jgi:hypothetical protein
VLPRGCFDRAGQVGVGRQRPVDVPVSAQDVGQHDRITTIGFPPGLPVPISYVESAQPLIMVSAEDCVTGGDRVGRGVGGVGRGVGG